MNFNETPIDYITPLGMVGQVEITVEVEESNAELIVTDANGSIELRLDRNEIAELISSLARAMTKLA